MTPTLLLLLSLVVAPQAFTPSAPPALDRPAPITLKLVDAGLEEAIEMMGRAAGITIQWDASISDEVRSQPVTASFVNAQLDKALDLLTREAGLTYVVVDAKTVRIAPPVR
jgi:type II secretory pathway component GspD/PulD (secretin)